MTTREKYPDDTLPGYLRDLRNNGTEGDALSAWLYGSEMRTREIARERLDYLRELRPSTRS